jgi:hypothetical protein
LSFDAKNLDKELSYIVHSFEGKLHDMGVESVADLIEVGERQIAIEVLCELLNEDSVPVESDVYKRIVKVGERLRVKKMYFECLKPLIIKDQG